MSSLLIQGFGYLASVLLGISLLVNNDLKFRWLNTGGCVAFIIYGILINAFPIILTNTVLLLINLYTLLKIYKKGEDFDLLEFGVDATLIAKFLGFYEEDIHAYFPEFELRAEENDIRFVVLRDIVIANVFVASLTEDGTADVKLNYTVPKYRDYKVGRFIFDKEKTYLVSKGVKRIVYKKVANKSHEQFLKVMGFTKMGSGYVKELV
ncbi:MAG TPA: YgjV family protein [Flavisolibacter sp.]|nr:YgjV family protein [Flavisolibacter sp.]